MKTISSVLAGGTGESFGARMRLAREHAGVTLKDAAKSIGMSPGHLSRVERDSVQMVSDPATLVRAGKTYGVSNVWLYAGGHAGPKLTPAWHSPA